MIVRLFIAAFALIVGLCTSAFAQTTGQVMFVGFNADGDDGFAFATLVDIPANTTIYFTDNEWDGVSAFTTGEGFNSWSHTAIVPAGTVITVRNLDNSPAITSTLGTAIVDGGTAMNIAAVDEAVYMFLGTNRTTPTIFLSAISNEDFATSGTLTATGLSVGVNAIEFTGDEDVMVYRNNVNCNSTVATCAAAIANTSNWNTFNNGGNDTGNFNVCDVAGTLFFPMTTYYSRASGIWDSNTSWSLSSDGSTGAVAAGVWPRRTDNVVIRNSHTITINAVNDNKSCGNSPNGLNRSNVSTFTGSADLMFYHTGDILISSGGTLVSTEEVMIEGYTHVENGGTLNVNEDIVNLGYFEVSAATTFSNTDDLILSGNSITIINNTSTGFDDIYIDHTNATLCGTGVMNIGNGSPDPAIQYFNGASINQICSTFTVTCSMNCPGGFPMTGTGNFSSGNTGPGGVGNATGSGDVRLWLDANTINQSTGTNVTAWTDQSGYGNNASAVAGREPVFNTGQLNGFPAVEFTVGNTDYLRVAHHNSLSPSRVSLFCVGNITSASSANSGLITKVASLTNPYQGYALAKSGATLQSLFVIDDAAHILTSSSTYTSGEYVVFGSVYNQATMELYHNETNVGSLAQTAAITANTNFLYLGIVPDAAGSGVVAPLDGDIAEAIVIGRNVNSAERIIINNFLSAKYDRTLGANDVYTMDNVGNGNYDFEVAGIGQTAATSYHKDARGRGVVRMWNPNNLGNGEFLMWGHDNTALNSSTTAVGTAVDGTVIQERLSRIWRVSEVGDVGTVSISFDFSGVGGSPLGSNLRLLIDRDGDGFADNDVTPVVGSVSNGVATFSNVNFVTGDRFTLGNTDASLALPIELLDFKAQPANDLVLINWTTASELNNDFFMVQRSADAEDWQDVVMVKGAGTISTRKSYQVVDMKPYEGASYYRLKQTDFDGTISFSKIEHVNFNTASRLIVYPNPSIGVFRLVGTTKLAQVRVYTTIGQLISPKIGWDEGELFIDLQAHPSGIYLLQVSDGLSIKSIRIIKH